MHKECLLDGGEIRHGELIFVPCKLKDDAVGITYAVYATCFPWRFLFATFEKGLAKIDYV